MSIFAKTTKTNCCYKKYLAKSWNPCQNKMLVLYFLQTTDMLNHYVSKMGISSSINIFYDLTALWLGYLVRFKHKKRLG